MTYVEVSSCLLEDLDAMVREGYYGSRTEAVNDALQLLIKQYKLSKLRQKDEAALHAGSPGPEDPPVELRATGLRPEGP